MQTRLMNTDFITRRAFLLQVLGIVAGLLLSLLYASQQILTGDQLQMLEKGYLGAKESIWLAYGNAASAVGNVPGYLSALIVGLPLVIWDNPWAPMLLLIAVRLASYYLFDAVIKKIFDSKMRLFFMLVYWLNPWFLYDSLIYNPAYLCFFMALHFWSAFKLREQANFTYSFLHVLAIGGAMQLHYSWPILAVISCFLLYRKMARPNWAGVFSAAFLIFLSLIPYFQEMLVNESISRESDRYIGYGAVHVYPVLKAVLYWLRYGSTLFSNRIITGASFDWLTSISWLQMCFYYLWQALLFGLGAASLVLSAKINWQGFKKVKPYLKANAEIKDEKLWLLLFAAATIFAIIINAMLSPITFSYWHLIMTFPIALIPLILFVDDLAKSNQIKLNKIFIALTGFFLLVNLIAANDSQKFSYKVDYATEVNLYLTK